MTIEDVLDDRQAQPGAAQLARPRRIGPVKPLGQPGQMLARDSVTMVTHRYRDKGGNTGPLRRPEAAMRHRR